MTQPPSEPPEEMPRPTTQETTIVETVEPDTLVGAEPPYVAAPPPPSDRGIGAGMLLGLAVVALVALGIGLAYLLTHILAAPVMLQACLASVKRAISVMNPP